MVSPIVEALLWIFFSLICLIFLIIVLIKLLPIIFKRFITNFDGSYEPLKDKIPIQTDGDLTSQENIPKVFVNPVTHVYQVDFGDRRAFINGAVRIHYQNQWYSSNPTAQEHKLECIKEQTQQESSIWGDAVVLTLIWQLDQTNLQILTSIHQYKAQNYVIFEIKTLSSLENITIGRFEQPTVIFPSFDNMSPNQRILTYRTNVFSPPIRDFNFVTSPVLFFDDRKNGVLLSALDHFIVSGIQKEGTTIPSTSATKLNDNLRINCGINGLIRQIPAGESFKFIMIFDHGINKMFKKWGELLRQAYNAVPKDRYIDLMNQKLGFFTDNGAYYYYNPINKRFDQTLIKLKEDAAQEKIPYAYYHLDSWWYQKHLKMKSWKRYLIELFKIRLGGGIYGGAFRWELDPHYFDETSLKTISEKMGNAPFTAHHRWYVEDTPYAEKFTFVKENKWAYSLDPAYWDFIMKLAKDNNIILYEQDWMISHFNHFSAFKADLYVADQWLDLMAKAAAKYGLTIQYCMATPAMWMTAIKHPNVTNVRASNDYRAEWPHSFDVPYFTQASMLARALNLWPFKDVFYTTRRGKVMGERCPDLEALISSLSAGPVAPGDPIGYVNKNIIHALCRSDGMLFKPDRPLTAADIVYIRNQKYYFATTESHQQDAFWYYVIMINLWPHRVKDTSFTLDEIDIHGEFVEYDFFTKNARKLGSQSINQVNLKFEEYSYRIYSPIYGNSWALLGDVSRYVTMNDLTFSNFSPQANGFEIRIKSIKGEKINLSVYCERIANVIEIDSRQVHGRTFDYSENNHLLTISIMFDETKEILLKVSF